MNRKPPFIASHEDWLEEFGEVELIGGWAEIAPNEEFAALIDASDYQVFLTSYDPVLLFCAKPNVLEDRSLFVSYLKVLTR